MAQFLRRFAIVFAILVVLEPFTPILAAANSDDDDDDGFKFKFIPELTDEEVAPHREKRSLPLWILAAAGAVLTGYCLGRGTRAAYAMLRAYLDMRRANYVNCDKYFHCRGNYEAARFGTCGRRVAEAISAAREWSQAGGSHGSDSAEDIVANDFGRSGGDCVRRYITNSNPRCRLPRNLW